MNILVINGDCILTNSSANLCHLAYIRGLVNAGHEVTLICADSKGHKIDRSMTIPDSVKMITFDSMTIYEKLSLKRKRQSINYHPEINDIKKKKVSLKAKVINAAKYIIRSYYGPHSIYGKFAKVARRYTSEKTFDVTLSLATPASSHLLAYYLIKSKHITTKKWVQIWEDPWYLGIDVQGNQRVRKEEEKLLKVAEKICYVSPVTLKYQQREFPQWADKMFWQPLPHYYVPEETQTNTQNKNIYGYFGEYNPNSRNLKPFYEAAKKENIEVNICGNPYGLFDETELIHIYPRMTLGELKPIEDSSNVLIFLCNRKGGQIPGKIYQYSATYKTILFILDGTEEEAQIIKNYFEKFRRYTFCRNNVKSIREAIQLIEGKKLNNTIDEPVEAFNPETIVEQILNC